MSPDRPERVTARDIARVIHADLKALGFRRDRTRWNRSLGELVHVITVETAKGLEDVTVSVGVFDRAVHAAIWGPKPKTFASDADCVVLTRLGPLMGRGGGPWWRLDVAAVEPIRAAIHDVGVPWLDRLQTRAALVDEFQALHRESRPMPMEIVGLAFLKAQMGDLRGGCADLASIDARPGGATWQTWLADLANRLGCAEQGPESSRDIDQR